MDFEAHHREVYEALNAIGNPAFGESVRIDRGSELEHLGIRIPVLRARVKEGFSFSNLPEEEILAIWDHLWRTSPYADVLFAALEYYIPRVRRHVDPTLWPVIKHWPNRIDNWCHCDALCAIFSRILEAQPETFAQFEEWNQDQGQWLRRISLVSLIHYTGKNAVFFPPRQVIPMVVHCLDDHRHYVQTAVGWVLREMYRAHPQEITRQIEQHNARFGSAAFARAIEAMPTEEKQRLKELRRQGTRNPD